MIPSLALVGLTVAVLAVVGLHLLLARQGPVWLGGVIPVLFVLSVGALIVAGRLPAGRPYVVSLAGLGMLLWMWGSARQNRAQNQPQVDNTPAHREPSGMPPSGS